MTDQIVKWCNNISPRSEKENMVIRYGAELLIDNSIRLLMVLLAGCLIGKGYETIIILAVFCGIRSQAGGIHAKTGWGCGIGMFGVWLFSLVCSEMIGLPLWSIHIIYLVSMGITMVIVPQTVNRDCYSKKMILRKKVNTCFLLSFCYMVACGSVGIQGYVMWPLVVEMGTVVMGLEKKGRGEVETS